MSDYITTYSGVHFEPTKPEKDKIQITDIAHALSLICRGNGHVKQFFSVGQHCINCALEAKARGYSTRVQLACLLHDASEAYMSDVPRPFKAFLKEYNMYEDALLQIIYEKYLGSSIKADESKRLKEIDDDLLYYDLKILLQEVSPIDPPDIKIALTYEVLPFTTVEQQYLDLFYKLSADMNAF